MDITSAKQEDLKEIYLLGKDCPAFAVSGDSCFWSIDDLANWQKSESAIFLVAKDGDKIVGFILTSLQVGKATIENLYVTEEYRGTGASTELLSACTEQLKTKGVNYACFLVRSDNQKTREYFKEQGFSEGFEFFWFGKHI